MTEAVEESAPPALLDHCKNTYAAMMAEANKVGESIIYEGFLTRLFSEKLHLSVPYYTSVRQRLIAMGCVRQLRRGGGTAPSQWELIYEPTEEAFFRADNNRGLKAKATAASTHRDQTDEQIRNINRRVSDLETTCDQLVEALAQLLGTEPVEEK